MLIPLGAAARQVVTKDSNFSISLILNFYIDLKATRSSQASLTTLPHSSAIRYKRAVAEQESEPH